MNVQLEVVNGIPHGYVEGESPPRSWLLAMFLDDMRGQEDFYLRELDRAEAGEVITDLYNHCVHVYPLADQDRVVLEDMQELAIEDGEVEGPRRCTYLTFAQARQLIHSWLEAKRRFYAEVRANEVKTLPSPTSK